MAAAKTVGRGGPLLLLLVVLCCAVFGSTLGLQFRMFGGPHGIAEECVGEWVGFQQWDVVLATVERNWRHHTNRNLTDDEIKHRLRTFKRPLSFEVGFVTFSVNPNDDTPKPVTYYIKDHEGQVIFAGPNEPVTQDEITFGEKFVGGKGPYYICFKSDTKKGAVDIDIGYFHINVPEAIGTEFEKNSWKMSEDDIRDMQPSITEEDMEYFAKEEHIISLKQDTRKLGGAVYHAHNEQQHIKQIQIWQNRLLAYVAFKLKVYGLAESVLIVLCSMLQFYFLRRLFKNKKAMAQLGGFGDL